MDEILIIILLTLLLSGTGSWFLTGLLRKYAVRKKIFDIPNQRSSHKIPIPRGGGVAIVFTFVIGAVLLFLLGKLDLNAIIGLSGAGILVGLVGFKDDRGHVSLVWRLLVHFLAVIWGVAWLGNAFAKLPNEMMHFNSLFLPVEIIFLVWVLNLFNFMDGIDGIAASETLFVAGCGLLFSTLTGHADQQLVAILLIGATFGFLLWNWPPAKIFMGDAGSGFLGITLGLYAYWTATGDVVTFWTWAIIMGVFLVDATFTLFRRILRKQRWYEAHRSHAYQHAAQRWGHLPVTMSVTFINIFWLLPIAYFSNQYRDRGPELMILALTPLIVLAFILGAGKETQ
ncbi:MAG: glycosyltransferase family 4 protein [Gammaproteobacteria bacterium]